MVKENRKINEEYSELGDQVRLCHHTVTISLRRLVETRLGRAQSSGRSERRDRKSLPRTRSADLDLARRKARPHPRNISLERTHPAVREHRGRRVSVLHHTGCHHDHRPFSSIPRSRYKGLQQRIQSQQEDIYKLETSNHRCLPWFAVLTPSLSSTARLSSEDRCITRRQRESAQTRKHRTGEPSSEPTTLALERRSDGLGRRCS